MAPWWLRSSVDVEEIDEEENEAVSDEAAEERERRGKEAPEPKKGRADGEAQGGSGGSRRRRRRRRRRGSGGEGAAKESPEPSSQDDEKSRRGGEAREERRGSKQGGSEPKDGGSDREARPAREIAMAVEDSQDFEEVESVSSGVVYVPESRSSNDERKIAMFLDFENIALGVRDSETKSFDVGLILERMLEKGKLVVKRAYADWERYSEFKRPLHEAAIELIDIPHKRYSGKNSADIKMVVDAIDLCYSKDHLDTFVLVTGDSDFSPLVSKLKENDKYVIGFGVKNSTSHLLIDNCDEFIYYEDVWRDSLRAPRLDHLPEKEAACFQLMVEAMLALFREGKDVIWGSQLKQTMKRKRPSFHEGYYGYSTFSELLEDAERKNIVRLKRDRRSGGHIVVGFVPRGKQR